MKCTCGCQHCCKQPVTGSDVPSSDVDELLVENFNISGETENDIGSPEGPLAIDFRHKFFGLDTRAFRLPRPDELALPAEQGVSLVKTTATTIKSGLSVARATDYKYATSETMNIKQAVLSTLSLEQRQMYEAWISKAYIVPDIDWERDKLPCSQKIKMQSRAKAMARLFEVPSTTATPENYQWLAQTNKDIANMVVAIDAFSRAKRRLQGGQSNLSPKEFAEYQTLRAISKAYNKSFDCVPRRAAYHDLTTSDRAVIDERREKLKAKLVKSQKN